MADIVPNESKINDVEIKFQANLSEILFARFGANINSLLDSGKVEIFGVGSHTWTKPANLKRPVMVILTGAGGRVSLSIPSTGDASLFRYSGGGASAGTAIKTFAASDLGATEAVEIVASADTGTCTFGSHLSVDTPTRVFVNSGSGDFNWLPGSPTTPTGGDINIQGQGGGVPYKADGFTCGGNGGASYWGGGFRGGHVSDAEAVGGSGFLFRGNSSTAPGSGAGGFAFKRTSSGVSVTSNFDGGPGLCMVIIL